MNPGAPDAWIFDQTHQAYYQPSTGYWAVPHPTTGQWQYYPPSGPSALPHTSHQATSTPAPATTPVGEEEDGEVKDDVGWGGLMEPEQLAEAVKKTKNGAASNATVAAQPQQYDDPRLYAYNPNRRERTPPKETPSHILRLVVEDSNVLNLGSVVVIDAREGGVHIGRDRCEKGAQARLRLKEMEVSKTHAVVYWQEKVAKDEEREIPAREEGWFIVDLGSTHGTFVAAGSDHSNDTDERTLEGSRLSDGKESSQPRRLLHLANIKIGTTILSAHIHASWPCDACQLRGVNEIRLDDGSHPDKPEAPEEPAEPVKWAMDSKERRQNRETKRKREMAALRSNLLDEEVDLAAEERKEQKKLERAAMRRKMRANSPQPGFKAAQAAQAAESTPPGSASAPPTVSSFAQSMMSKQGWESGQGLGKDGAGRSDPVQTELRTERRGLGAEGSKAVIDEGPGDWRQRGKARRYDELQDRFKGDDA